MSKKANPTIVGAFIIGAVALAVGALVVFGSGSLFHARPRAVAFFQGDIQGLSVGAPVTLRGVPVGTVTDIRIDVNIAEMVPRIPVYLEFDPERLHFTDLKLSPAEIRQQGILKAAIDKGLHASLASQSFVTGQLLVNLSLDPNEPSKLVGADPSTVEIPTSLSGIEKIKQTFSQIPLDQIAASLLHTLDGIDHVVTSPEIPALLKSLAAASNNLDTFTTSADKNLGPLVTNLGDTLKAAQKTLAAANSALSGADGTLKEANRLLSTDGRATFTAATDALNRATKLLTDANSLVSTSSAQRYDINEILRNLAATTRSLRSLSAELDRKPNAVLLGK
jgi:paraquat-inducible protein B